MIDQLLNLPHDAAARGRFQTLVGAGLAHRPREVLGAPGAAGLADALKVEVARQSGDDLGHFGRELARSAFAPAGQEGSGFREGEPWGAGALQLLAEAVDGAGRAAHFPGDLFGQVLCQRDGGIGVPDENGLTGLALPGLQEAVLSWPIAAGGAGRPG